MTRHCVLIGLIVVFALALPGSTSAQTPPAAAEVVAKAVAQAKAANKAVLIEFGASWCTWCRNFEAFVKSPDAGPILAEHFVIVNLTVRERDDKKVLEHPGGDVAMDRWGGAMSGLPYYVFLNGAGDKVADSNAMPDGTNIGFPAVPDEIRAFIALMDKAAPTLPVAKRDVLQAYLVRVMPKPAN
jgi:thioredoxin-related protein